MTVTAIKVCIRRIITVLYPSARKLLSSQAVSIISDNQFITTFIRCRDTLR